MRHRTVWVAALALCVYATGLLLDARFELWVGAILGGATVMVLLGLWRREERRSARLSEELSRERARASDAWTQAWQNALLAHASEELRAVPGSVELWTKAAEALGRALDAARVAVYRRDGHGSYRVWTQFAAEGLAPLSESLSLPTALVNDRDLSAKLASAGLEASADAELRALAGRPRARILVPVERSEDKDLAVVVHPLDESRRFTEGERRFVQRFAEHVAQLAADRSTDQRRGRALQRGEALVELARALAAAREPDAVADIAVRVGAPLAGADSASLLVERESKGFVAVSETAGGLSRADVQSLLPALEDAVRRRGPLVTPRKILEAGTTVRLLAPLFYGRELLGVLVLQGPEGRTSFSAEELETARRIAELTGASLKNARFLESLREAEKLRDRLVDASPDLRLTLRRRGGAVVEARGGLLRTLGLSRSALRGSDFEKLLTTDCLPRFRKLERALAGRKTVPELLLRLRARGGEEVDVLVSGVVEAELLHLLLRDVTEVGRLEHQLRQSQKLSITGSLAGGLAHDLNNVLGGILGYASLLRAQLEERPGAARYVETIERSAIRGAELIGRLLAASRKLPTRREAVSLNLVVEETVELLAHTVDRKIRIEKSLDPGVHAMIADASQLQQIVLNLCVNARDAMRDGGLLRVETRLESSQERVRLTVEDTGVGMDSKTLERLFEPFFSTKGERGTGLGLSVVYGVVKGLGGDIRVQSSPGRGARFDVFLPCQWAQEAVSESSTEAPAHGEGELILLVDDEKVLRDLGKEILEAHGYRVETAENGEQALAFVRESKDRVALVILDVVMPGIDGGETLRRLRRHDQALPVLLSTGLSAEESVQDLLRESATGFIGKPYGMGELTRAVGSALRGAELIH